MIGSVENIDNVNIYPNPTTGMVNINFKNELEGASMKVVNSAGKTVDSESNLKIPIGTKLIDMSKYENGLYIITIESGKLKYNYKVLINK